MLKSGTATLCPFGAIAQLGERLDRTQEVAGSSPASSMKDLQRQVFCCLFWSAGGYGHLEKRMRG